MAGVLNQFFTMMELRFGVVIIHPDQEMSGLAQVEDTRPVLLFYIKQDQIAEQHGFAGNVLLQKQIQPF